MIQSVVIDSSEKITVHPTKTFTLKHLDRKRMSPMKGSTLDDYHQNEQTINKVIIYNLIVMTWVGLSLIVFAVIWSCIKNRDPNVIILASGAIIEIVSGGLLVLAKREMDSRDKFFEALSKSEEHKELVKVINSIPDETTRIQCMKEYIGYIIK